MLPIRPRRLDGESALGYVMRLAEAHGVRDTHAALADLGTRWFRIVQGRDLRIVSRATGTDLPALMHDTGRTSPRGVRLRGEILRRRQWSLHRTRACCPVCFLTDVPREGGRKLPRRWHRTWWDVRSVTVCPTHRTRLKHSCDVCRADFGFAVSPVDRCPNGHPIDRQQAETIERCMGDAYVVGRLSRHNPIANPLLDSGTLGEAIDCMELVGTHALLGRKSRPSKMPEAHLVLDAGFRVFAAWPGVYDAMLDSLVGSADVRPGRWGSAAAYGPLHAGLQELGSGPIARAMKDRMRQHAAAEGVSFSKPVFGASAVADRFLTLRASAERLRSSPASARTMLSARGLIPVRTRRGTPIRVAASEVDRLASERQASFGINGLAARLGVGRTQARTLAEALYGSDRHSFTQADVDALLDELSHDLPAVFEAGGAAPLPQACQLARCSIVTVVQAVRQRRLIPVGRRKVKGLRQIVVRIADVRALGNATRGTLTLNEAARELHVKWETMRGLVRLRLVTKSGKKIRAETIDTFRRDFIAGADLARANDASPKSLVELLAEAGLEPAAYPPRCRQVFYRRSDLGPFAGRKLFIVSRTIEFRIPEPPGA